MATRFDTKTMALPNLLVIRKPRLFRLLVIALLMILSLFVSAPSPHKVSASDTGNAPQVGGPLVPTTPFSIDRHNMTKPGNYARVVIYTWGIDPTVEQDPNN